MRRNYHRKLGGEIIKNHATCLHGAKEGGREGYRESVREIEGNREQKGE